MMINHFGTGGFVWAVGYYLDPLMHNFNGMTAEWYETHFQIFKYW